MVFVFFCLTYFTQYDYLQLHPCSCKMALFHCFLWLSITFTYTHSHHTSLFIQSLGWEDPLEEKTVTSSSILAGRGACWATVHGVAKSWTRLSD